MTSSAQTPEPTDEQRADRKPWQRWHRHRWTKWENEPTTRIHNDVRHCEVCNKRQMRQP